MKRSQSDIVLDEMVGDLSSLLRRQIPLTAEELVKVPDLFQRIVSLKDLKATFKSSVRRRNTGITTRLNAVIGQLNREDGNLGRHNLRLCSFKMGDTRFRRIVPINGLLEHPAVRSVFDDSDLNGFRIALEQTEDRAEKQVMPLLKLANATSTAKMRTEEALGLPVSKARRFVLSIKEVFSKSLPGVEA